MSDTIKDSNTEQEEANQVELSSLDEDSQLLVVYNRLEQFCIDLELQGVEQHVIDSVLLSLFVDRMTVLGDREQFDEILSEALLEEWPEITVH
jgi:hypothetical protein